MMEFSDELMQHLRKGIGDRDRAKTTDVPAVLVVPLLDRIDTLRTEVSTLQARIKELEEALLSGEKYLDCLYCHKIFPLNKMYSVDACCSEHQEMLQ